MTEKILVHLISLGCPKNLVDAEVMLGLLLEGGYEAVSDPEQAEVLIINTCSFVRDAKEESISSILEMAKLRKSGNCKQLVVTGCLAQRYAKELAGELPEVDLYVGTGQYHRIVEFLRGYAEQKTASPRTEVDTPEFIHTEHHPRVHSGPAYTGYLKISEGCDRRCAFCIIPDIRGRVRSRTIASLVAEARLMVAGGVKELSLVAQDLTEFGKDRKYEERLETLLPELCKIEGLKWIRLHYVYPDEFSDELIEIIASQPKIVKYLDMPIQHTSDRILRMMNRRLKKERIFSLVEKLRERIPDLVIRTSIIVGFPGETEEDFNELCSDLLDLKLDRVGVFNFSREEGTKAFSLDEQVHPSTRNRRERKLLELMENQSLELQQRLVGTTLPFLIEGPSAESDLLVQGRSFGQAIEIDGHVLINELADDFKEGDLRPGAMVEVEVTQAHPFDLIGRAVRLVR